MRKNEISITRHGKTVAHITPGQPRSSAAGVGREEPSCSFCGKEQTNVAQLIAGPTAFICNECVDLCVSILSEEK